MKALTVPTRHAPGRAPVRVHLHGVKHALESFEILVFLNLPAEEVATAGPDHPRFVGSLTMFGFGFPRSADESVPQSAPFDMTADLFPPADADAVRLTGNELTLVLLDADGQRLNPELLHFDSVSVQSTP